MAENARWKQAINTLMDNLVHQFDPLDQNIKDKGLKYQRTDADWFQFYTVLYIKYIYVYKDLQQCYHRLTHPQKRILLREMLEANLLRVFELKEQIIRYSTEGKVIRSDFVNLDPILEQLKIRHEDIAMYVPRHYRQDYDPDRYKRNQIVDKFLIDLKDTDAPQQQIILQQSLLDSNILFAIRLIQKIQRGRQGIARVMKAFYIKKRQDKKKMQGDNLDDDGDGGRKQQISTIQKGIRGYLTRKKVKQLRQEQLIFLGMVPPKQTLQAQKNKLDKKDKQLNQLKRQKDKQYREQTQSLKDDLLSKWEQPMKDKMLVQRRQWINQFLQKICITKFRIQSNNSMTKIRLRFHQHHRKNNYRLNLQNKKKNKKKAKKKKKLSQRDQFLKQHSKGGPTPAVVKLQDQVKKHAQVWDQKQQGPDIQVQLVKQQVIPKVQQQIQTMVDDMIQLELANLRIKLKKKKGKSKKKKKPKKPKTIKVPGWKQIQKIPPLDQIGHLVDFGVLKKLAPAKIQDFVGQPNLMRPKQQKLAEQMPDPSMWDLRQIVIQTICLPLGSQYVRDNITKLHYFLFFGPIGSGKTLMVRAIAQQCDALILELSPSTLQAKINQKKQLNKMIAMTFNVAKTFSPAIIYMDQIQQIFKAKKKKKKGAPPAGPNFTKLRKTLTKYKKKVLKKDDRVAVIGCTNKPWQMNKKFIKPFVQRKFYFPFPNYATRKALFQYFMQKKGIKLPDLFPVSSIAYATQGCTSGNLKQAVDKVANQRRLAQIAQKNRSRPFQHMQFIGPIASQPSTYIEQYQKFREWNDQLTGLKLRRDKLAELNQPDQKK